ncbi:MAG: hypothetical protein CM1200mP30_34020 [Pseudomonadota bacterium]|nr:MAG: hypothetical protein CM1200mP30_34020 [Pseudomonadota bacterium]
MSEAGMEFNVLSALHPAVRTHPETGRRRFTLIKLTPLTSKTGKAGE